jgi:O-antigen ligase
VFFLGFTGLSLLWSSSASLSTSIAYWCAMAADVAIVSLLLREGPPMDVSASLMKGYVWGACAVALIAWLMPAQSDLRLGDEELLGANQIGYICGFGFFFALYLIRAKKEAFVVKSVILGVTLLRSLSKTTILAVLVGGGFLLVSDKSISRRSKMLITILALIIVAASWGLLASYFDIYTNAGNQSETLTGRIGIWAYFFAEALQQPWIGDGFDSVWKVVPPFGSDQFEAAHAHNELLQQFYAYGLVGIGMFAGIYVSFFRHVRMLSRGPLRSFLLAFLIFVLVRGGADTERFDLSLPLWSIVLLSMLIEYERLLRQELTSTPPEAQTGLLGS